LFILLGVAGSSLAATVQSIFYKGSATGIFSLLQSTGAAGMALNTKILLGSSTAVGTYFGSLERDSGECGLQLQVFAFCRVGHIREDTNNIEEFLKYRFGVKDVPFTVVEMTPSGNKNFNYMCDEETNKETAPGCLISFDIPKNQIINSKL